jgi:hypothetical protein
MKVEDAFKLGKQDAYSGDRCLWSFKSSRLKNAYNEGYLKGLEELKAKAVQAMIKDPP